MNIQKLVCGIGINDSCEPVTMHSVISGKKKRIWICPFYQAWLNMIDRCYSGRRPSYSDCSVHNDWIYFSSFRLWMESKDWQGNELDKDLLFPGNKIYGPDTCLFISAELNAFLTDRAAKRGNWPLGVCWCKDNLKFRSLCWNPFTGKRDSLGYFSCPNQAHEAWRKRKHSHALRYADMQNDPLIAQALRKRFATLERTTSAAATNR